ncbi:MAG: tetratricopeptide repeat protein [Polyangiaceae bacterium]
MAKGPLDHPRLLAVERKLDAGQLDEAQHLLAQLGESTVFRHAISYLATRLLYQRGTLDEAGVIQRLETILAEAGDFPEAHGMLDAARAGTLDRAPGAILSSRPPPQMASSRPPPGALGSRPPPRAPSSRPPNSAEPDIRIAVSRPLESERPAVMPVIPRGGRVPDVGAPRARATPDPSRPPSIPDLDVPGGTRPPPGFSEEIRDHRPRPPLDSGPVIEVTRPDPVERRAPEAAEPPSRYSTATSDAEVIAIPRRAPSVPPVSADPAPRPRPSRPPPPVPEAIVSEVPPPVGATSLSLFEIAELLDLGQADRALEELARSKSQHEPDHVLMAARVLARIGRFDEAREHLHRLAKAPLVEPEVRAGVARLAIELGELELALSQARQALDEDPRQPMIRLSFAWAGVRYARREADAEVLREAAHALGEIVAERSPHEGLLAGLRVRGSLTQETQRRARALLANRALELEPSVDALAASAIAAARLVRVDEASLRERTLACGQPGRSSGAGSRTRQTRRQALRSGSRGRELPASGGESRGRGRERLGPLELAIVAGRNADAWLRFSQLAEDTLSQVTRPARHEVPALSAVAASFFTVAPVSRDFAPYDETPASLARVDALLDLLSRRGAASLATDAAVTLAGAYIGEILRQHLGLRWHAPHASPPTPGWRAAWARFNRS